MGRVLVCISTNVIHDERNGVKRREFNILLKEKEGTNLIDFIF